jgi:hypothetical protein
MVDIHVYLDVLQKLLEAISVSVKDFGLVEIQFFWFSSWLSHSDRVNRKGSVEV